MSIPFKKMSGLYILSCGGLLLITAVAKVIASGSAVEVLRTLDPIFGVTFNNLILTAGIVEFIIACICIFSNRITLRAGLLAILSTNLLFYRFGLYLVGYHRPCICMGTFTASLHISEQTADTIMKIFLAYMFIGSYATLFWLWRQPKKTVSSAIGVASL